MEIMYCKKWWFPRKRPIEILEEEIAHNNHLQGEEYTAVLSQNGLIKYILEISKNDVFVNFMDSDVRKYLTYAFHRETDDDIFLNVDYYHRYEREKETELIIFSFEKSGRMNIEKQNLVNGYLDTKETFTEVACNWDKFPEFGNYSSLIVEERELSM